MADEPRTGVCEFCDRRRYVRTVTLGKGKFELCIECETGMKAANTRKIKESLNKRDEEE